MLFLPKGARTGCVEVDTSTLDGDEWFFVIALQGEKPNAPLEKVREYREVRGRLTPKECSTRLRRGLDKLIDRGFIRKAVDKDGRPQREWNPTTQQYEQPFEVVGKLITHLQSVPADQKRS